jgi:hypothetical protein
MISLIVGITFAIILIEVAAGMWIGRWLFPSQPEQSCATVRDRDGRASKDRKPV